MSRLSRSALMRATVQVGCSTIVAKALGMVRLILEARYLGTGTIADAFVTAFRIPNSFRKIFAEGALTSAFVPTMVAVHKEHGLLAASRLVTGMFVTVQTFLLLVCISMAIAAPTIVSLIMPGWCFADAAVRITLTASLLRWLIFFIVFISSASLLSGALQALHHFALPAWSQVIVNGIWIVQVALCLYYELPVQFLAYAMLINGAILLLVQAAAYNYYGLSIAWPDRQTWCALHQVLTKFLPCVVSMGALEINLFIDQTLASYLPSGSVSLLYYTNGFMRLPLAVFATSFATILLPHFARIHVRVPRRLHFYMFEVTKLVLWVTAPVSLLMIIFAQKALATTLLSSNFTLDHISIAAQLLTVYAAALFFFSLNRILLNMYYAMHETVIPTVITVVTTIINTLLNIILMNYWGVLGIVIATCTAEIIKTIVLIVILSKKFSLHFYGRRLAAFIMQYALQLGIAGILFVLGYIVMYSCLSFLPTVYRAVAFDTFAYWLWVGPLIMGVALFLYVSRRWFGIKLHFID